jgi:hypothetical protein
MHLASANFDEEEHIDGLQTDDFHCKKSQASNCSL